MKIGARIISIVIVIVASISFSFAPLLNVIGYEFAAVMSILISFLSGIVAISATRTNLFKSNRFRLNRKYYQFYFSLILIPVIISTATTLLMQDCPVKDGILLYFLFVPPAAFIGITLGALAAQLKKLKYLSFVLLYLIVLLTPLFEIYFRPQIYLYNSIFTFFPGTMYDENIAITSKMILYRLYSLLPFVLILLLLANRKITSKSASPYLSVVSFLLLFGAIVYLKPVAEFSTTESVLKNYLKGEAVTDHFIINYPASLTDDELRNQILNHEFYYTRISETTGIVHNKKIRSFIFRDKEQKRELFGAGNADVAKPWLGQVYTGVNSYNSSLKHEIVHVFASNIGSTFLKLADSWNPAMLEGYAMAVENNYNSYDVHYLAYLARKNEYLFPIPDLFSGFKFLTGTSSISYIYAGSFIKYLIDQFGIEKVNRLYSNIDFRAVLGKDIIILEDEYYKFLDSLNYQNNSATAKLFYGYAPIFKKTCPRATAVQIDLGWEHYSRSDYFEAYSIFNNVYNYSGSYAALTGSIQSLIKMKEYAGAYKLLKDDYDKYIESSYAFKIKILLADLAEINGDLKYASILYESISLDPPNEYYSSIANARLYLKSISGGVFQEYIEGGAIDRLLILMDHINNSNRIHFTNIILSLAESADLSNHKIEQYITARFSKSLFGYSYLNSRIADYFARHGKYNLSLDYSRFAEETARRERRPVYTENLEKSIWISKFADSVLSNVKYK